MVDKVRGIVSLTSDRIDLFTRSLNSIIKAVDSSDNRLVAVFDDSSSETIRNHKRSLISQLANDERHLIIYVGLEEKKNYLEKLTSELPAYLKKSSVIMLSDDIEITASGAGSNRNHALAAFMGKKFVSMDDDTELKVLRLKKTSEEVIFAHDSISLDICSCSDLNDLDELVEYPGIDPFGYFDSFLGACVNLNNQELANNKIRGAMSGLYGGKWYSRPFGILFHEGKLRNITFSSLIKYNKTKYHPFAFIQSPNIQISSSFVFIGSSIGIDARSIVPFFLPQVRNQDNIWGITLKACCRNSAIVHLPFAVYHDYESKTPFTENDFKKVGSDLGLHMTLLFSLISEKIKNSISDDRFKTFGESLIELSELPHHKWMELCRALWHKHVGDTVNSLNQLLENYEREPSFWAKDVDKFMDRLRSTSMDAEAFIPRELHSAGSVEEAGRIHRKMLNNYGTLLTHWTQIWDVICRMNEAGEGLLKDEYNRSL